MVRSALRGCWLCSLLLSAALRALAQPDAGPPPEGPKAVTYGAVATIKEPPPPPVVTGVAPEEVPGTFGDPFRILESMPGATPMVSGLPYVYVRGSPPSGNGYYYDGIPLPQLYHLGLGPAVLHPSMLGPLQFDPGVSSARYGRRLGAVLSADAPPQPQAPRLRLEARLLDANMALAVPYEGGSVMAAGRFGYPGLVTPALGIELQFSYWDYQLRLRHHLSDSDYLELIVMGSKDALDDAQAVGASIGYDDDEDQPLDLEFHRIEARLVRRRRRTVIGFAVRTGYDASMAGTDVAARAASLAPRLWVRGRLPGGHRLEAGVDMVAASGRTREVPRTASFALSAVNAVSRNTAGAYADGEFALAPAVRLGLGLRGDLWIVGETATPSLDPRARLRVFPMADLELFAGVGLVHQPVVFAFPLPGFTDVALDRGLQEGLQSELGARLALPGDLRLEANLFLHRYSDLLLPEIYLRALGDEAQRVSAQSYGGELFLRCEGDHAVNGFVSYTLGFAEAVEPFDQRTFAPEFDIRHVLNLVLQARIAGGLVASASLRLRSGKPANQFTDEGVPPYYELRLPGFLRIDGRLAYNFATSFAELSVYVEMLNMTLAREVVDAECFFGACEPVAERPIWFPNLGFRADL